MCDIYTDKCQFCGKPLEMHLGDFLTAREEVAVWCSRCFDPTRWAYRAWSRYQVDSNVGTYTPVPTYDSVWVIVHLTPNAVVNRDDNCPNVFHCLLVETEAGVVAPPP